MKAILRRSVAVSIAVLLCSFFRPAHADTLAKWTFENSLPHGFFGGGTWYTNIAPELGSGTASSFHSSFVLYSSPTGNGSSHSFGTSSNWSVGDFFQFTVSTIGYNDLSISYDQTGSAGGPRDFVFEYSLNGSAFTTFSSYSVVSNGFNGVFWNASTGYPEYSLSFDLSSFSALGNSPLVYFRVVDNSTTAINGGIVTTAGHDMDLLDNFTVSASPVPEPVSFTLMGLGGLVFLLSRRHRH